MPGWILVAVGCAAAVCAFVALIAQFCSTNTVDEQREMRVGSRVAERFLAPPRQAVRDWPDRELRARREGYYGECDAVARSRRASMHAVPERGGEVA